MIQCPLLGLHALKRGFLLVDLVLHVQQVSH
jgi:hypothetical protein